MIDACVHPLPDGGYRLWYKDEVDDSHTWAADSPDLEHWEGVGPVITYRPHEGPTSSRSPAGTGWSSTSGAGKASSTPRT